MMRGINLASLVRQHPCQLWGRGMLCTTYRVASVYELWYQWRSPSPTLGISPPFGVVYTRSRIFLAFLPPRLSANVSPPLRDKIGVLRFVLHTTYRLLGA